MDAILSRKAKDAELGAAKKRLEQTIAYWGTNWNARSLEELPEYVQDLYILYTYTIWLEEQLTLAKDFEDDLPIFAIEPSDTETPPRNDQQPPDEPSHEGRVVQGVGVPEPILPSDQPTPVVGSGEDHNRPLDQHHSNNGGNS